MEHAQAAAPTSRSSAHSQWKREAFNRVVGMSKTCAPQKAFNLHVSDASLTCTDQNQGPTCLFFFSNLLSDDATIKFQNSPASCQAKFFRFGVAVRINLPKNKTCSPYFLRHLHLSRSKHTRSNANDFDISIFAYCLLQEASQNQR